LREKGIDEALITDALISVKQNEVENALHVWQKKYDSLPTSREDWARQARFLQSRGFGFDVIKKVLNTKKDFE